MVLSLLFAGAVAVASPDHGNHDATLPWGPIQGPSYSLGKGVELQFFPARNLHERYTADPRQSFMKFMYQYIIESDTVEIGKNFFSISLGGRGKVFQLHPTGNPYVGVLVSVEAGFIGLFDLNAQFDAQGWDGFYAIRTDYRLTRQWGAKLAIQHDSGHVADEYIAKTGRERVIYTREELALGVDYRPVDLLRLYVDGGYAYHLNADMMPWRMQAGVEVESEHFYAAMDATSWQELNWRTTGTWQAGVLWKVDRTSRAHRLGVQYESGRNVLSEFYQENNKTLGVGVWVDL